MGVDCLKCINSACCKLKITIDKKEYDSLKPKIKNQFIRHTDIFIQKNPKYKNKANQIDLMYIDNYAVMKKGNDGFCNFLDRNTKLCTVYKDRLNICKTYTNDRCKKIRQLCTN